MSKICKEGVLENFQAIKNNFSEYNRAKKENFEWDVNIDSSWTNDSEGERFVLDVAEGTMPGLVRPYVGLRGQQKLNIIEIAPTWQTDGRDAIASDGTGPFDENNVNGDINLDDVTIDVRQEFFQVKVNPFALDNTIYRNETGSSYDPNMAAASYVMESAVKEMRNRLASQFFSGFAGASNGLNNLTFAEVSGQPNAAIAESNILDALKGLAESVAATDSAGRQDNVILLSPTHYQYYINALVGASFATSFLHEQVIAGRNETLSQIPLIYNPSITVVSDMTYTGQPKLFQLDKVFFGTTALTENEMPDLWYSKDNNAYYVRGIIYGGVQTIDNTGFFTPDVSA